MVDNKENYKFNLGVEGLKTLDNILVIIHTWPLVDAFEQQYKKKFTCD